MIFFISEMPLLEKVYKGGRKCCVLSLSPAQLHYRSNGWLFRSRSYFTMTLDYVRARALFSLTHDLFAVDDIQALGGLSNTLSGEVEELVMGSHLLGCHLFDGS